jgi:hypothetical protein
LAGFINSSKNKMFQISYKEKKSIGNIVETTTTTKNIGKSIIIII